MSAEKFVQLSHFLRSPGWEATNNGAERTARTFRHCQAAHFNLRSADAISAAVGISAQLQTERKDSLNRSRSTLVNEEGIDGQTATAINRERS